jgi:hypothetical protein
MKSQRPAGRCRNRRASPIDTSLKDTTVSQAKSQTEPARRLESILTVKPSPPPRQDSRTPLSGGYSERSECSKTPGSQTVAIWDPKVT